MSGQARRAVRANGVNGLVYWSFAAVSPFVMGLAKNSLVTSFA